MPSEMGQYLDLVDGLPLQFEGRGAPFLALGQPLTLTEAARYLRMSPKTLRGFVKAGAIPWIPAGHGKKRQRRLFDLDDLNAFKNSQKKIGAVECPSLKERLKAPIRMTSSKVDAGLPEILAQRIAAKRNASKNASAKKRAT